MGGGLRYALIDTGAPVQVPTTRMRAGSWRLDGFPDALRIDVPEGTVDADARFRVVSWPISLLLGLESLATADWVLDLEGGEWRFLTSARRGP